MLEMGVVIMIGAAALAKCPPAFQTFLQMRAGAHVLIAQPMKFQASFAQPFWHIHPAAALRSRGLLASSLTRPLHRGGVACACLAPNLPTRVGFGTVSLPRVFSTFPPWPVAFYPWPWRQSPINRPRPWRLDAQSGASFSIGVYPV